MAWPKVELSSVARIQAGGKSGRSGLNLVDDGYPAYGAGGLNGMLPEWEFEDGAVILSSIGARCGKCFLPSGKWSSLANTQLIFPDPEIVDRRFLWYLLNDEGRWHRSGTAQPYIKPSDVKSNRIPLPPLPEQRRIASILDHVESLRGSRQNVSAVVDALETRFIDQAIDLRIGTRPLSDHISFLTSGSRGWARYYSPAGRPFIRIQNVVRGRLAVHDLQRVEAPESREADRTRVRVDDVLMSITADLGRAAVVPAQLAGAHVSQHLALIRLHDISPRFVAAFLSSGVGLKQLLSLNRGATKQGLNFDDVRSIRMPTLTPSAESDLEDKLAMIDQVRELVDAHAAKLDELFASLQYRAFRGEL